MKCPECSAEVRKGLSSGTAFSRDDIIRFSLKADANIDEIRTILMQPRFRDRLGITRKVKETNRGVTFKNSPKSDLRNIWELEGDPKSNVTFINLIAYERRRFDIKGTEEAEEDARLSLAYVKDLLQRSEYSIGVEQASLDHTEYLVNTLIGYCNVICTAGGLSESSPKPYSNRHNQGHATVQRGGWV